MSERIMRVSLIIQTGRFALSDACAREAWIEPSSTACVFATHTSARPGRRRPQRGATCEAQGGGRPSQKGIKQRERAAGAQS